MLEHTGMVVPAPSQFNTTSNTHSGRNNYLEQISVCCERVDKL